MSPQKKKILVVDDSELVLDMMEMLLEDAGYDVITCETPFRAFVAINKEHPDLVLLDLSMPGIDGDQLLGIIEESGVTHKSSIVLHSSRSEAELQRVVERTGADGYIRKTDDPDAFVELVGHFIAKSE